MTKRTLILIVTILGVSITVGLVGLAIFYGRYLEAVAASCIVPVLVWFATGAGKLGE